MVVVMLFVTSGFQYLGKGNATTVTERTHEGEGLSETKEEVWSMAMVVVMFFIIAMFVV
jgi:hypothetical protein